MGLAVLLGSSLFILSVISSSCIFASPKDIKLNKGFFLRDSIFLVGALSAILYTVVMRGVIDMKVSIALVVIYLVYVGIVLIQEKIHNRNKNLT